MPKMFSSACMVDYQRYVTVKKPITSTMNKNKRRSFKKYRGQGK